MSNTEPDKGKDTLEDYILTDYTVKKAFRYSRPQPGCHLPNSPWAGIMTSYCINYSRLVSEIPAEDGIIEKLFD
jgi:hypothetical protein